MAKCTCGSSSVGSNVHSTWCDSLLLDDIGLDNQDGWTEFSTFKRDEVSGVYIYITNDQNKLNHGHHFTYYPMFGLSHSSKILSPAYFKHHVYMQQSVSRIWVDQELYNDPSLRDSIARCLGRSGILRICSK